MLKLTPPRSLIILSRQTIVYFNLFRITTTSTWKSNNRRFFTSEYFISPVGSLKYIKIKWSIDYQFSGSTWTQNQINCDPTIINYLHMYIIYECTHISPNTVIIRLYGRIIHTTHLHVLSSLDKSSTDINFSYSCVPLGIIPNPSATVMINNFAASVLFGAVKNIDPPGYKIEN